MFVSTLFAEGIKDCLGSDHADFLPEHQFLEMRRVTLQGFLDLAAEELGRRNCQFLALLAVDPQQLLC